MKKVILLLAVLMINIGLFAQSAWVEECALDFVAIPEKNYSISTTEVTQDLYEKVMGDNPSGTPGVKHPVEQVSWYDAVYFCNKWSEAVGKTPVYSVNGSTDVSTWNYVPHIGKAVKDTVEQDCNANGFRLPTVEEWIYAARGGEQFLIYSGSDNLDEVAWYEENSGDDTHPVAQKKPNGYGLYDMSGNVWEWCWNEDSDYTYYRYVCGGAYTSEEGKQCSVFASAETERSNRQYDNLGFRVVCTSE